jgi:hypothetical protein
VVRGVPAGALGLFLGSLYWIPLDATGTTIGIFFCASLLSVSCDVIIDGHLLRAYSANATLHQMLQMMGTLTLDLILCFVSVQFFTPVLFLVFGGLTILAVPALWLITWYGDLAASLAFLWEDIRKTVWTLGIGTVYYFVTCFFDANVQYFCAYLLDSDPARIGYCYGMYVIGMYLGLSFAQFFFLKLKYKLSLGLLFFMFLRPGHATGLIYAMFFFGGFTISASDSVTDTFSIQTSQLSRTPAFLYAWFRSWQNVAYIAGGVAFPLIRQKIEWIYYFVINLAILLVAAVASFGVYFFCPSAKNNETIDSYPTLTLKYCRCLNKDWKVGGREEVFTE